MSDGPSDKLPTQPISGPGDLTTMYPEEGDDTLADVDQAGGWCESGLVPWDIDPDLGGDYFSEPFEPIDETPKRKTPESSLTPHTQKKRQNTSTPTGDLAAMSFPRNSQKSEDTLNGEDQARAGGERVQWHPKVQTIKIRTIKNARYHQNQLKGERERFPSFEEIRCFNFNENHQRLELWIMKQRCAAIWVYGSFKPIQYEVYKGKGRKEGKREHGGVLEADGSFSISYNQTVCFQSAIEIPGTGIRFKEFYMTQATGWLKEYLDEREEVLHVDKCRQYGINCSLSMDNNCAVCAVHGGKWPENKAFILEKFIQEPKNMKPSRKQAPEIEANERAGGTVDEAYACGTVDEAYAGGTVDEEVEGAPHALHASIG